MADRPAEPPSPRTGNNPVFIVGITTTSMTPFSGLNGYPGRTIPFSVFPTAEQADICLSHLLEVDNYTKAFQKLNEMKYGIYKNEITPLFRPFNVLKGDFITVISYPSLLLSQSISVLFGIEPDVISPLGISPFTHLDLPDVLRLNGSFIQTMVLHHTVC